MEYLVGTALALFAGAFASFIGLDRDRAFYPTVMIVIATLYVVFAVIDGSPRVLAVEIAIASVYVVVAVAGFKGNPWLIVAALAAHGVMDLFHQLLVRNAGVPRSWPGFCMAYDVIAALYLGLRIEASRRRAEQVLETSTLDAVGSRPSARGPGHVDDVPIGQRALREGHEAVAEAGMRRRAQDAAAAQDRDEFVPFGLVRPERSGQVRREPGAGDGRRQ